MGRRDVYLTGLLCILYITSIQAQQITIDTVNLIKFKGDTAVIGVNGGLYKADPLTFQVYDTSYPEANITGYAVDQEDYEWIEHDHSLSRSNGSHQETIIEKSFRDDYTYRYSLFLDESSDGNIWYSLKKGSSKAHSQPGQVINYIYSYGKNFFEKADQTLDNKAITAVEEGFIGTKRGLFRVHQDTIEFVNDPWDIFSLESVSGKIRYTGQVNSLSGNESLLWIGTERGLLKREAGEWEKYTPQNTALRDSSIAITEEVSGGGVWVASEKEVAYNDKGDWTIFNRENSPFGDNNMPVKDISEDPYGRVWVGTDKGIWIYDNGHWREAGFSSGASQDILAGKPEKSSSEYIVSPTVAAERLTLTSCKGKKVKYSIYDPSGSTYDEGNFTEMTKVDISGYQQGMFLIRFYGEGGEAVVKRFVKE